MMHEYIAEVNCLLICSQQLVAVTWSNVNKQTKASVSEEQSTLHVLKHPNSCSTPFPLNGEKVGTLSQSA
jgi:hypothetical protein